MQAFQRIARRVKPQPVKTFIVLFDATKPIAAPFCGKAPAPAAQPKQPAPACDPYADLTPSDRRHIDSIRHDAYLDAVGCLGEHAAREFAADCAEQAVTKLRMSRELRKAAQQAERRAVVSDADSLWWAMTRDAEERWESLEERYAERTAEDRLTYGVAM